MRLSASLFVIFCLAFLPGSADASGKGNIIVSQDYTEALAKSLTANTSIAVTRVVPEGYSPETHASYMKKHWQNFADQCREADAAITVAGSWPADPLYPFARRANIRIVAIDSTRPLDQSRAGIPLLAIPGTSQPLRYAWYSPGNAARMADITAADLEQLFPKEALVIAKNRDSLKQELFKLRTRYEMAFSRLEAFELLSLTADFSYLTDDLGLNIVEFFLTPEPRWSEKELQQFSRTMASTGVKTILAKWQPREAIQQAIDLAGARLVLLEPFKPDQGLAPQEQLLAYYKKNLDRLLEGLSP